MQEAASTSTAMYPTFTEFYTANNPREDRSCAHTWEYNGQPIYMVGMYDGHGGHQCAEYVKGHLGHNVCEAIRVCRDENPSEEVCSEAELCLGLCAYRVVGNTGRCWFRA